MRLLSSLSVFAFLLASLSISSCKKEGGASDNSKQTTTGNKSGGSNISALESMGRYSGADYSQSISITAANAMISSYLSSVNFPVKDTAIRSLAFDADTLRSYLADTSIKTIRFYMAHTPAQTQSNFGNHAGYNPNALTMIIVGYSQNSALIKNKYSGVYEHLYPCPWRCDPASSANGLLLQ